MSKRRKFLMVLLIAGIWAFVIAGDRTPALCEESQSECSAEGARWEQAVKDLDRELSEYESVKKTPVESIVRKPVVDLNSNKPIAEQVSDALRVKEEVLKGKRKSCRTLLSLEKESFDKYLECMENAGGRGKDNYIRRLKKDRDRLLNKVRIAIAEVREVRGSNDYAQYNNSWSGQNAYGGGANNYWGNQMQMYRQYWGR